MHQRRSDFAQSAASRTLVDVATSLANEGLARIQAPDVRKWRSVNATKLPAIFAGLRELCSNIVDDLRAHAIEITHDLWLLFEQGVGYDEQDEKWWAKLLSHLTSKYWIELMAVVPRSDQSLRAL